MKDKKKEKKNRIVPLEKRPRFEHLFISFISNLFRISTFGFRIYVTPIPTFTPIMGEGGEETSACAFVANQNRVTHWNSDGYFILFFLPVNR